jgi:hypothetical protein
MGFCLLLLGCTTSLREFVKANGVRNLHSKNYREMHGVLLVVARLRNKPERVCKGKWCTQCCPQFYRDLSHRSDCPTKHKTYMRKMVLKQAMHSRTWPFLGQRA